MEDSGKKRYNPEELEEFRILIEKKIAQAREDLNMLRADNANDISDTTPTYKDLDEGAITQSRLENDAQAQRLQDFIEKLEAALLRIQTALMGSAPSRASSSPRSVSVRYLIRRRVSRLSSTETSVSKVIPHLI